MTSGLFTVVALRPDVTFSICAREAYETGEGGTETRFGVAVTTRLPGVGTLCPFANEHGAVATQSLVNVDLGRKGAAYLADGLAVDDALEALLNADEQSSLRQLHGVGSEEEFAFSGEDCKPWYGHHVGENYTVAGNLLTGEAVMEETAAAYETRAADGADTDDEAPLAGRLIDALAAGQEAGGDRREELRVQSAALLVCTTEDRDPEPFYDDLRVDATETPVADLRETYELAREGFEAAVERESEDAEDANAGEGDSE